MCIRDSLSEYSLPTLEISYNAREEDVADIFVRVNSGGQRLTENNFIQTLISVYENETSDQMNLFCEQSRIPASGTSYNNIIAIEPSHLIRMAVGVGFRRARLRYAYTVSYTHLDVYKRQEGGLTVGGHQGHDLILDGLDTAVDLVAQAALHDLLLALRGNVQPFHFRLDLSGDLLAGDIHKGSQMRCG